MRVRMDVKDRREQLMAAAMEVARRDGYATMTRRAVANEAHCSSPLISSYFGPLADLRDLVVKQAIKTEDMKIIAQAMVAGHRYVKKLPEALKVRARAALK